MTRRDQVLRSWIEKTHPKGNWHSCISHRGKLHRKSTHTRIRRAALEFNLLHLSEVLFPTTTSTNVTAHQTELPWTEHPSSSTLKPSTPLPLPSSPKSGASPCTAAVTR